MKEFEYKVLLNENEYSMILNMFEWDKKILQVNHYFSDDNYEISNSTVRVRTIDHEYLLQIKVLIEEKIYTLSEEYEKKVEYIPEVITGDTINYLFGLKFNDVKRIGKLQTERMVKYYDKDILICLDKNEYWGIVDYELEIECNGELPLPLPLCQKINEIGVNFYGKKVGKYERFLYERRKNIK